MVFFYKPGNKYFQIGHEKYQFFVQRAMNCTIYMQFMIFIKSIEIRERIVKTNKIWRIMNYRF